MFDVSFFDFFFQLLMFNYRSVISSKSFGEKFPALVTGFFFFMW